jgi:predicted LPLAT superfamily acyltransferase
LNGRYQIFLEPFAETILIPHRQPQRQQELTAWAGRFAECMENHCRQAPLQWFNFFPFWPVSTASGQAEHGET